MEISDPTIVIVLLSVCASTAALAVTLTVICQRSSARNRHLLLQGFDIPRHYVFRDGYLVDGPEGDDAFLTDPEDRVGAWVELTEGLSVLNPDISAKMDGLRTRREGFVLIGRIIDDALSITGHARGEEITVTVVASTSENERRVVDKAGLDAVESEVEFLRHAMGHCGAVMWLEDEDGKITWANAGYFSALERVDADADALVWPIHAIFREHTTPPPEEGRIRRCAVYVADQDMPLWYDISMSVVQGGGLFTARPIDRLVEAETSLRDFVQTLSRTFAHLPVGLAIFDKRRQLVLFNPALVTLSSLSTEWLSTRPDLYSFLDQLREHQRMPEPKDYQSWKSDLAALEAAARDGSYQELWTLPNGQTYRVIGRPHADGAVAFMFEDISSEVSLTRKFRGELELYQTVFDAQDDAMVVFSKDGLRMKSNAAFGEIWPKEASTDLQGASVVDVTRSLQEASYPTPLWGEIRDFVGGFSERSGWTDRVSLRTGDVLDCKVAPLKGGASLIAFTQVQPQGEHTRAALERLTIRQ